MYALVGLNHLVGSAVSCAYQSSRGTIKVVDNSFSPVHFSAQYYLNEEMPDVLRDTAESCRNIAHISVISALSFHLCFIALLCDLGSELLCLHIKQEGPLRIMFIVAMGKLRTPIKMSRTL